MSGVRIQSVDAPRLCVRRRARGVRKKAHINATPHTYHSGRTFSYTSSRVMASRNYTRLTACMFLSARYSLNGEPKARIFSKKASRRRCRCSRHDHWEQGRGGGVEQERQRVEGCSARSRECRPVICNGAVTRRLDALKLRTPLDY